MSHGMRIDRKTYSAIKELLCTMKYIAATTPFICESKKIAENDYTVTIMEWREWKSQEEKAKWLKILKLQK